ncbi:MAG: hypothetical protein JSS71_06735 [Armatimonadetes bacterium]|nr:hypothetical protein [Armatimonadota bacterium]MBX3107672.1 hypothetical protein [Fimbriimonadaceae bacterium]
MAWNTDLLAIRDWIGSVVLTLDPGMRVAFDQPDAEFGAPFARVETRDATFHSDSVLTDRLELTFAISIRIEVSEGNVSEALLAKAVALRAALLAQANPAGVGESPLVRRIQVGQAHKGGTQHDLTVEFSCLLTAGRGI